MPDFSQKLDKLIESVVIANGSDLHLSVGRMPMMRVSTSLIPMVNQEALSKDEVMGMLSSMLGDEKKFNRFLETQEVDFAYDFRGSARLRGNAYRTSNYSAGQNAR
jgi:twitching motility protein PilT